jgi:choline monooxygenase
MNQLSPATPNSAEAVRSLPADWYFDPAVYEAERRQIFAKTWQFIGPESEFERPGDYRAVQVAGYRLFVIRERAGGLRAFHNICPHRAAPLLSEGDGHCDVLRCRYHGWSFATDGRLVATPNFGEAAWFDKKAHGLTPVRVEVWRGLVFAAIDDAAPSLIEFLGDLPALLEPYPIETFGKLDQAAFAMNCNWKTYTDNFVEGYHIPGIHAGLNAAVDMSRFETTHQRGVVIMKAPQKGGSIYGGLWLWIWPNMTLSVYPDGMNTSRIIPTSEERTELRYEFYFADAAAGLTEKRRATIETNCGIVREDFGICEEVQQNLRSGIYRDGPLSPRHEDGVKYFQDMVRQSLAQE